MAEKSEVKRRRRGEKAPAEMVENAAPRDDAAEEAPPESGMLVVGIGASAGGLSALKQFLQAMPGDSGMAFVIIQHLDPNHQSLMASLLSPHTTMSVVQVTEGLPVAPNSVYLIPPGKTMTLKDGVLHLAQPQEPRGMRLPIDAFLLSLAEDQEEHAVGIVMSGSASDGTEGVRDVKAHGGLVIVQQPEEAEHDWMPRSAIATGLVDLVLPVAEMPEALLAYLKTPYVSQKEVPIEPEDGDALTGILAVLASRLGHDFRGYRRSTLLRRIQRRMGFRRIHTLEEYREYLRTDPQEISALFSDFLIGVTRFFREPEAWEALKEQVVKPLVERESAGPLRAWVPGCSTGKEAYSLAMLFLATGDELDRPLDLQIFATDIDDDALTYARAGEYPLDIVEEVPAEYLSRYFTRSERGYRATRELRQVVVFAPQNVLADPPFSRLDLISCRNLLIYLEPEVQEELIKVFHFALRPEGHLFLGNSESIGPQHDLFDAISRQWRIYRRAGRRADVLDLPLGFHGRPIAAKGGPMQPIAAPGDRSALHRLTENIVLEQYAPAAVLVDAHDQIIYYLGRTDDFLHHPRGEPTDDLPSRLDESLRGQVRGTLAEAWRSGQRQTLSAIILGAQGLGRVTIEVSPLRGVRERDLLLVVFQSSPVLPEAATEDTPTSSVLVQNLEQELRAAREETQGMVEELESANEELTASNEEIVSMNEELQSANEELETSKEELQSLNEELRTVNSELQARVAQLEQATNDQQNLLHSTNIPTIFLDQSLHLKRFTPPTVALLNLLPGDVGRPISDLSLNVEGLDVLGDARAVLADLQPVSREVHTQGRAYIHRTQPYRTQDNTIEGVVMTFVDITELERARAETRRQAAELAAIEMTMAEQRERQRLAQVLHDVLQQLLVAAKLGIDMAAPSLEAGPRAALDQSRAHLLEAIATSRNLAHQLSPPALREQGLAAALGWLAQSMQERHQLLVHTELDPAAEPESEALALFLFDAARELLFNVVKHAGVSEAELRLVGRDEGFVELIVRDKGAGFAVPELERRAAAGFGMLSIRDRAALLRGEMRIESEPGKGATISLCMPRRITGEASPRPREAGEAGGGN